MVRLPAAEPRRVPQARADLRLRLHHPSAAPASRSPISGTSANLLGWLMSRRRRVGRAAATRACSCPPSEPIDVDGTGSGDAMGSNHVEPGGAPLVVRLSAAVTMTKVSVGPMDNNAYLLQPRGGGTVLIDAANDEPATAQAHRRPSRLDTIVTTHRHGDHWQALPAVAAAHRRPAGLRPAGRRRHRRGRRGRAAWSGSGTATRSSWATETLEVIGLVGHTPGSITLAYAGRRGRRTCSPGTACSPVGRARPTARRTSPR